MWFVRRFDTGTDGRSSTSLTSNRPRGPAESPREIRLEHGRPNSVRTARHLFHATADKTVNFARPSYVRHIQRPPSSHPPHPPPTCPPCSVRPPRPARRPAYVSPATGLRTYARFAAGVYPDPGRTCLRRLLRSTVTAFLDPVSMVSTRVSTATTTCTRTYAPPYSLKINAVQKPVSARN